MFRSSKSPRLANLAVGPPGLRYKQSGMPFIQMENISLFLGACKAPPLNLQEHDIFLTIDLYESKDPAQVLQCLGAFSRAAHSVNPSAFPNVIGPKTSRVGMVTPHGTGGPGSPSRGCRLSNASNVSGSTVGPGLGPGLASARMDGQVSGRWSPTKSPSKNGSTSPTVASSWLKKEHEGATSPGWNAAHYGYLGGANQGKLGISFGGRRQIISAGPCVPNVAEKERVRQEKEADEERIRLEKEEEQRRIEAEEERARLQEEKMWEEETDRQRVREIRKQEEEKRRWEEEERQWKLTEELRKREDEEAEARIEEQRRRARSRSREPKLQGQYLSQYQAGQGTGSNGSSYSKRIRELEKELELARQREAEYQARRKKPGDRSSSKSRSRSRSRPRLPTRMDSWSKDEREVLRTPRHTSPQDTEFRSPVVEEVLPPKSPRSRPVLTANAPRPRPESKRMGGGRPLPDPTVPSPVKVNNHHTAGRPLPEAPAPQKSPRRIPSPQPSPRKMPSPRPHPPEPKPEILSPRPRQATPANRIGPFEASKPTLSSSSPATTYGRDLGLDPLQGAVDSQPQESRTTAKPSGWASKSLLEREMEMERQRQKEWEQAQKETESRVRPADGGVDGIGGGIGGRWDVSQWAGYTGGDSQNRGSQGIGAGKRQIVGPRPLPGIPGQR